MRYTVTTDEVEIFVGDAIIGTYIERTDEKGKILDYYFEPIDEEMSVEQQEKIVEVLYEYSMKFNRGAALPDSLYLNDRFELLENLSN